ncbi:mitochondrial transcription factor B2 isoform X2 [Tachypleus tridentatus]
MHLFQRLFDKISKRNFAIQPFASSKRLNRIKWSSPNSVIHGFETKTEEPVVKKKRNVQKKSEENIDLMTIPPDVAEVIQHQGLTGRWIKSTRFPDNLYIASTQIADILTHQLISQFLGDETCVFEASPGLCLLTKGLLKAGVPHLRVFEKRTDSLSHLEDLKEQYPSQLEIVKEDILNLPKLTARDMHTGDNTVDQLLKGVQHREWKESPPLKIVAVLSEKREVTFLRFLLSRLSLQTSVYAVGRTQLFVFVTGKEYMYMTASAGDNYMKYRSSTVLYNLFFDIELLKKIPRNYFLPPFKRQAKSCKKIMYDAENLYLMKLTPRANLFETVGSPEKLPDLFFFVKQHLMKRNSLVIPTLEKWIPHCGPRLIKEGMTIFTKFGDLTPTEILNIFNNFSSWQEYEDSPFKAAVHRNLGEVDGEVHYEDE